MVQTYRYRLYPNQTHQAALGNVLFAACALYNHALAYPAQAVEREPPKRLVQRVSRHVAGLAQRGPDG